MNIKITPMTEGLIVERHDGDKTPPSKTLKKPSTFDLLTEEQSLIIQSADPYQALIELENCADDDCIEVICSAGTYHLHKADHRGLGNSVVIHEVEQTTVRLPLTEPETPDEKAESLTMNQTADAD